MMTRTKTSSWWNATATGMLLLAALLLAPTARAQEDSVVTIALNADVRTLDPVSTRDTTTSLVLRNLYESLFMWGEGETNGVMEPLLALSYEWDGDLTWTVQLREDVVFHNGEAFDADDVVTTFRYVMEPANEAVTRSRIEQIVSVEKVDDHTVRFVTDEPFPTMLQSLHSIPIAPAGVLADGGLESLMEHPVGTGAYQFVSWDRERSIVLEKNPAYHQGEPEIDRVVFTIVPDINSRVAALLAGEVDLIYALPTQTIRTVERNGETAVRAAAPGRRIMFLGLDNVNPGPMQDVRVRQAINHAVDVNLIIDTVMEGYATRVPGPLVPQNMHFDEAVEPYAYDPARARALLEEAGYGDGLTITLNTPQGRYLKDVEFAQAIASQLAEVGITVDMQVHEWGNFLDRLTDRQLGDVYVNGRPDLDLDGSILSNFFRTDQAFVSFSDPELDVALDAALAIVDPAERAAAYATLQRQVQEKAPWLFLWAQHDLYGVAEWLEWQPRDDEQILVQRMGVR